MNGNNKTEEKMQRKYNRKRKETTEQPKQQKREVEKGEDNMECMRTIHKE